MAETLIQNKILGFCTPSYEHLFQQLILKNQVKGISIEEGVKTKDGNSSWKFEENQILNRNIFILSGITSDLELLELIFLTQSLYAEGPNKIVICIPFLKCESELTLEQYRWRIKLFNSLPKIHERTHILLFEPEISIYEHFFEDSFCVKFISSFQLHLELIEYLTKFTYEDFVFAPITCQDFSRVEEFANYFHKGIVFLYSKSLTGVDIERQVKGKKVILYSQNLGDQSLLDHQLSIYKNAGAKTLDVIGIHANFNSDFTASHSAFPIHNMYVSNSNSSSLLLENTMGFHLYDISECIAEKIMQQF